VGAGGGRSTCTAALASGRTWLGSAVCGGRRGHLERLVRPTAAGPLGHPQHNITLGTRLPLPLPGTIVLSPAVRSARNCPLDALEDSAMGHVTGTRLADLEGAPPPGLGVSWSRVDAPGLRALARGRDCSAPSSGGRRPHRC